MPKNILKKRTLQQNKPQARQTHCSILKSELVKLISLKYFAMIKEQNTKIGLSKRLAPFSNVQTDVCNSLKSFKFNEIIFFFLF